jgi:hypothetical protein
MAAIGLSRPHRLNARRIKPADAKSSTRTGGAAAGVAPILAGRTTRRQGETMTEMAANEMVFCRACGKQLHFTALTCTQCGAQQQQQRVAAPGLPLDPNVSPRLLLPAVLLCFWFGVFGVHRFFVGKVGTGLLMLFTFGGLGLWALIDLIILVCGAFTDSDGRKLTQWT